MPIFYNMDAYAPDSGEHFPVFSLSESFCGFQINFLNLPGLKMAIFKKNKME